jgi:glycosyltransferase involved in cell wall biosynthesis
VRGDWPDPDDIARSALARVLGRLPDDSVVLVDGLVASPVPDLLVPQATRLRLVVLVHLPLGETPGQGDDPAVRASERASLTAARAVVATSGWTRDRLRESYGLTGVAIAEPGVDPAALTVTDESGGRLLCVGAVSPAKGHDVLLSALADVADLTWSCVWAGSLHRDQAFVDGLMHRAREGGIPDRLDYTGPLSVADLDAAYASADLLLHPSRVEAYGMAVTEALARGLPVLATDVGGLPDAVGHGADGARPGLLVPGDDPAALASALRSWLTDPGLRARLRATALERRRTLLDWSTTSAVLADVLTDVAS